MTGLTAPVDLLPSVPVGALVAAGGVLGVAIGLGAFGYLWSRYRLLTRGLRGTARVVDVRPVSLLQRRSVVEAPTERVTVATAARPGGVLVGQKVPAGQYRVGQVVPVVQHPKDPGRILLDRPDLERPLVVVLSPLGFVLVLPLVLYAAARSR